MALKHFDVYVGGGGETSSCVYRSQPSDLFVQDEELQPTTDEVGGVQLSNLTGPTFAHPSTMTEEREAEAQLRREEREAVAQLKREEAEAQQKCEEREAQLKREEQEREAQLRREEHEHEAQLRREERELEAKLKQQEVEANKERVATWKKWLRAKWVELVQGRLTGEAREAYNMLDLRKSTNYDAVKRAVLHSFKLTPECYRKRFRECTRSPGKSYPETARDMERKFLKWLESEGAKSAEDVKRLMVMEKFMSVLSPEIRVRVKEAGIKDLRAAADRADMLEEALRPRREGQHRPPEQWTPGVTVGTVNEYVQKLKERLTLAKELAGKQLKEAQRKMSEWYDKKATPREFQVGS
ncbi:uncharacterized protein [Procambarus clarkii]|uniref:uncharacterized protein n=1 Tax=Procambarus clarkii TaxID=6728 RepID=UPI003744A62E